LVFNPGFERVEGYTNFLWVVILAGFNAVGLAPESVSHVLTLGATAALWGVVVWFVMRDRPAAGKGWLVLIAPLLLACTRSVAVWSTSGLETRIFEAFMVGGVLRLIVEIEGILKNDKKPRPWSGLLFALGALTRPDMLLVSGIAMGTAWLTLVRRKRLDVRWAAVQAGVFGALVGGHYLFRYSYYGEWLPNTYYAKVGGRTWWDMGGIYLGLFLLEYAAYLWAPLLIGAALAHRRDDRLYVSGIYAAVILPHAVYVASVGGDHFEYRPLDLYFPFVFLLIYDGAKYFSRGRTATALTGGWLVLIGVGLTALPWQMHRQFPDRYVGGYPGLSNWQWGGEEYLLPENDPVYRWPVLRRVAEIHRSWLFRATLQLVAIRQEEHKLFLGTVKPEGQRMAKLIAEGRLPEDLFISIGCVGAIPYYSNVRTLDRAGLTDAHVAHHGVEMEERMMAHDKHATIEYGIEAGVTYWPLNPVSPIRHVTRVGFVGQIMEAHRAGMPLYCADGGEGYYLVGLLPQGLEALKVDGREIEFMPIGQGGILEKMLGEMVKAFGGMVAGNPEDLAARLGLASGLYYLGDFGGAADQYEAIARIRPDRMEIWWNLISCCERMGDTTRARSSTERAMQLAEESGDADLILRLEEKLKRIERQEIGAEG
jgi:arabinofuranosyltransferase